MIVPWATYRYVAKINDGARTLKKAAVLHTAVSNAASLYNWWQSAGNPGGPQLGTGAHLYIAQDGKLEQYLDTDRYTGHAWDANHWSVGIETWDGGHPDTTPWNQAQLDTIDRLLRTLGVPARALTESPSEGVGYHAEYPSWNKSNHSCPAGPRIAQVPGIIERLKTTEDDMDDTEKRQLAALANLAKGYAVKAGFTVPPFKDKDAVAGTWEKVGQRLYEDLNTP